MDFKRQRNNEQSEHLIADQNGMRVLIIGLSISFILGFSIRSILSPARISAQVAKAASHIHKDVKVTFESAQLSLADGILPGISVVITNVRMESLNVCWGAPVLEVDELRLPISLSSIFSGHGAIRNIQANIVKLNAREGLQNCASSPKETSALINPMASTPLVSLKPEESISTKYSNDIQAVSIQKLVLSSDKYPQYQADFLSFVVKVKSFEPKIIEVTAKSHLLQDTAVGDYLSHANIYLEYKESPEKTLQAHFFGNWREGHYSLIGNYIFDENLLNIETDLKHIPLSQVLALLQKYNLAGTGLNARQVWISSKGRLVSTIDNLRKSPLEIRDLVLEGDIGELRVPHLAVLSLEPLKYEPIAVEIRKLDVEKLLSFLNYPKKSSILGSLGQLTGRADIYSDKNIKIQGEHSGLEFVFSNKGQKELQVIDTIIGGVRFADDLWKFDIQRVEPREGTFVGGLSIEATKDFSVVEIKSRIEELSFAPAVQRVMTGDGEVGPLSLDADATLRDGRLSFLKGLLRIDIMNIEGMNFERTRAHMSWVDGQVLIQTQIKELQVAPSSSVAESLQTLSDPSWWGPQGMTMTSISADFRSLSFQRFSWRNVQAQVGKSGKFTSQGSWGESGDLEGTVVSREQKKQLRWSIQGSRSSPIFQPEGSAEKGSSN